MRDRLIQTFYNLVKIDSPSGGEEEIIKFVVKKLTDAGCKVYVDSGGNVLARCKGLGEPVLLSAHLDTVEPGRNIKPKIKNNSLVSDDTTILGADNKVAVASILDSLITVPANKRRSLEIILSVREETDGGINHVDFSELKSKEGLVADSGEPIGTVILASPWIEDFEIGVFGEAAHTSTPEEGINAISVAANAISNLKWGKINEVTTTNIGIINGGYVTNTVPPLVEIKGEIRSFSQESFKNAKSKIDKVFQSEAKILGAKASLNHLFYCKGYQIPKDSEIVQKLAGIYGKLKITPRLVSSFGGSDANVLRANGINAINIGDGVENPHTVEERVSVKSLVAGYYLRIYF